MKVGRVGLELFSSHRPNKVSPPFFPSAALPCPAVRLKISSVKGKNLSSSSANGVLQSLCEALSSVTVSETQQIVPAHTTTFTAVLCFFEAHS